MQFNDTTNLTGMIQFCEDYCKLGNTGISGNSTLLKKFTGYINKANRDVWHTAWSASAGWQYDDNNQTDLPVATTNLVASQTTYALISEALTIKKVEVLDNDDNWVELKPINLERITIAEDEFFDETGTPRYYKLVGNIIKLFPATDYAKTAGLKIYFDRGSVEFASTATTTEAGFATEYQDLLPLGASMTYWLGKPEGANIYQSLAYEYNRKLEQLKNFYSEKFGEQFPSRLTVRDVLKDNI